MSDPTHPNYQYAEDTPHTSGDIGTVALVVRKDAAGSLVDTDGDMAPLQVDSSGSLRVVGTVGVTGTVTVAEPVWVADGGASLTVDGTVTAVSAAERSEDSAHATGQTGLFVLGVRNDAGTSLVDATGDYAPLQVNSVGELRVTTSGGTPSGRDDTDAQVAVSTGLNTNVNRLYLFNGTTWDRANGRPSNTDAQAADGEGGLEVIDRNYVYNGTTWDRVRSAGSIGAVQVGGPAAHDTPAAGNPILTGAVAAAENTTITSVTAGDVTRLLADLKGLLYVKEQRPQLLGIYYAGSGPHIVGAAADAATGGRVWLVNTSSTIAVAIREIRYSIVAGTALITLTEPRINVERMTFTGTPSGAQITPGKRDSTDAANTGTLRTASTGMTITAGATMRNFSPTNALTAVGVSMPTEQVWTMQAHVDGRIVLRQNEGIVVRQADAGTVADTRTFFLDFAWEEYTL